MIRQSVRLLSLVLLLAITTSTITWAIAEHSSSYSSDLGSTVTEYHNSNGGSTRYHAANSRIGGEARVTAYYQDGTIHSRDTDTTYGGEAFAFVSYGSAVKHVAHHYQEYIAGK